MRLFLHEHVTFKFAHYIFCTHDVFTHEFFLRLDVFQMHLHAVLNILSFVAKDKFEDSGFCDYVTAVIFRCH